MRGTRFSLAGLLLLTTVVAVLLAAMSPLTSEDQRFDGEELAAAALIGAGCGLVVGIVVGVVRRRPLRSAAIGGPAGLFFGAVGGVLLSLPADLPALLVGSLVLVVFGAVVRRYSAR